MLTIRKAIQRGQTQTDWLNSFHSFSFADYYDPTHTHFSDLRVINEDYIAKGMGFGRHPHRNMEIITYVVKGELKHQDSLGTGSIIKPGEIQRMSAGKGILHSEFNASEIENLHLLQIWILPNEIGIEPSYEQKPFFHKENEFLLIGSVEDTVNAIKIHQDVNLYTALFNENFKLSKSLELERQYWLQLIEGRLEINGQLLEAGDGLAIVDEREILLTSITDSHFLFFDLKK